MSSLVKRLVQILECLSGFWTKFGLSLGIRRRNRFLMILFAG